MVSPPRELGRVTFNNVPPAMETLISRSWASMVVEPVLFNHFGLEPQKFICSSPRTGSAQFSLLQGLSYIDMQCAIMSVSDSVLQWYSDSIPRDNRESTTPLKKAKTKKLSVGSRIPPLTTTSHL